MKLRFFSDMCDVFVSCECGIAFKNAVTWDRCALLPVICAGFELSRDNCAHFNRIECLSLYDAST